MLTSLIPVSVGTGCDTQPRTSIVRCAHPPVTAADTDPSKPGATTISAVALRDVRNANRPVGSAPVGPTTSAPLPLTPVAVTSTATCAAPADTPARPSTRTITSLSSVVIGPLRTPPPVAVAAIRVGVTGA